MSYHVVVFDQVVVTKTKLQKKPRTGAAKRS
jgi:hypothetical protein